MIINNTHLRYIIFLLAALLLAAQSARAGSPKKEIVPAYQLKQKYFFWGELRAGPQNFGMRIINGYKFGRFAYLGVGTGFEVVEYGKNDNNGYGTANPNFSGGVYVPVYLRYEGDILKKQITPFYYTEFGYNCKATIEGRPEDKKNSIQRGGPILVLGFGGKFNTKRRASFALSANMTYRSNFYTATYAVTDAHGQNLPLTQSGSQHKVFAMFAFGLGF